MDDADDDPNDNDDAPRTTSQTPGPSSKRTKITYDKYMSVLNLLVQRVNEDEMTSGSGVEGEDLVMWYLEQKEDEIGSEEELLREGELVRKVIKRLVKDNILMQIRGEGLVGEEGEGSAAEGERVVYVLHPNCAVEEMGRVESSAAR
jgi:DNA replication licensing factor MCM6